MAHGYEQLKKTMYFNPTNVMLSGIIVAAISALAGIIANKTFFEGLWIKMEAINLKIGTPLLFDIGVYLAVYGVLMMIFATVMEELKWK
jgi:multicomponent Na+:H+ antiporter subunit B